MNLSQTEIIYIVLITISVILLIYALYQRSRVSREIERERKTVREAADEEIKNRTENLLRLSTIPFTWAIRSELQRENYTQIEQYMHQYVKEKGITHIALVENNGAIKLSTDKKREGRNLTEFYEDDIKGMEGISIIDKANDEKLIIAPITGINDKLGTIIISYHPKEV